MSSLNKKSLIIIIIFSLIILTGCWDSVEINKREYLFALGIDKVGDELIFTSEIPKINEGSEEQRLVYTKEGENFSDFYNTSYLHSDKAISDRLMQVIVLGESVARDTNTLKKIFDEMQRSPQLNRRVKLCIATESAQKIINTEIPSNPIVGRFLSDMLVKLKREGNQEIYTFDEALIDLGQTGNALIPVVEVNDKSLKIERAAIIKEYQLLGYLSVEELESLMVLLNPLKARIRNINIDIDGTTIALGVSDISSSKKLSIENEKITANYYMTLYVYVDSFIIGNNNLEKKQFKDKIKEEAEKKISKIMEQTIYTLQHTYKTDLLMLKKDLYKHHKKEYLSIENKYDEAFQSADINVYYDIKINSTGLVK